MKKHITSLGLIFFSLSLFAQLDGSTGRSVSTSILSDYQCLGINPGNLAFKDSAGTKFTLALAEFSSSLFSDALTRPELRKAFTTSVDPFNLEEKKNAAQAMINNGVGLNVNATLFGLAFRVEDMSFAAALKTRVEGYFQFDEQLSNILFQGFNYADYFDTIVVEQGDSIGVSFNPLNLSDLFGNSQISTSWTSEINLGMGGVVYASDEIKFLAGGDIKFINGIAMYDFGVVDGKLEGFAAVSPVFDVDFNSLNIDIPNTVSGNGIKPVGRGIGFDFGATLILKDRIKLSAALVDIGSIKWTGNLISIEDNILDSMRFKGFDSYNVYAEMISITGEELFDWKGEAERKQKLPTKLRLSGGLVLNNKWNLGVDIALPVNNSNINYSRPVIGLGGDFKPISQLRFTGGVVTGAYYGDFAIPAGIALLLGPSQNWEMSLSTRDISIFIGKNNPHLSACLGLLRFKF